MFFCGSHLHVILRNREIDKNWIRNEFGVLVFRADAIQARQPKQSKCRHRR